jgi:EmrB/QacA subfamily drug resistance transporter
MTATDLAPAATPLATQTSAAATTTPPSALDTPASAGNNPHHTRRWAILAVLATAQLMVVLDTTVVNIALPSAQKALGFSSGDRQWVVTAYALAFGSLLLLGGRLADLLGRKRVFIIGLVGFAAASAIGGAANGFGMLVTARAVQGAFGAMLAPAGLALLTTTFTQSKERAKAFGIYGAIAGGGAAVGLLLGGVLTEYLSWRWCMYVNLIFAVGAVLGGMALLHNQPAEDKPRLDIPGVVSVSAGLFSLVYGFSHAESAGWGDTTTVSFLVAGVLLLIAFVGIQTRSRNPLLPLRILADRNRSGAYLAIFIAGMGMFGAFLFLSYYMQGTLHYSAVMSGLAFIPLTVSLVATSISSTILLTQRVGPRWTVGIGLLIASAGMLLFTGIGVHTSYVAHILPGTIVMGIGMGLTFSRAMSLATSNVEHEDAGVASALVSTGQQVGGSIGTALLNTLAASAAASFVVTHGKSAAVVVSASIHGYVTAFWWAGGIFAVGAVICGLLLHSEVPISSGDAEVLPL